MNRENIDMAYAAGVLDGDGSFGIGKLSTKANPLYFPVIQFTNWRKELIDFLQSNFGGTVIATKGTVKKDGSIGHLIYRWKLRSRDNVKPVLERIIPFLKIKKDRANLLLEFINKMPFARGQMLSNEILVARERYYLKMINFNDWTNFDNNITTKLAKVNTNDQIFWSYIAGLMDTDGSFSVKKQIKNKGTHVVNPRYLPVISISMTDTRAINYIRENCMLGRFYIPNNKSCSMGFHYQFGIYTKAECIEFLNRIIPFLRSKTRNAQILQMFCEKSQNTKYCKAGISEYELAFRDACYQNLVSMNKYGVYKSSLIDLKILAGHAEDNKAQAAKACSVNVASEKTSKDDAVL